MKMIKDYISACFKKFVYGWKKKFIKYINAIKRFANVKNLVDNLGCSVYFSFEKSKII